MKKIKKDITVCLIITAILLPIMTPCAKALGRDSADSLRIYVNHTKTEGVNTFIKDGICFIAVRDILCAFDKKAVILWDPDEVCANVRARGIDIKIKYGEKYIEANGRVLYSGIKNDLSDGTLYVPLRSICKAFDAEVIWCEPKYSIYVTDKGNVIKSGNEFYDEADLYWLSHIIHSEACTESFEGKLAVGNVVINRVNSELYPDSIKDVILQEQNGVYQFTPVKNGRISRVSDLESILAAKVCLEGYSLSESILFFIHEAIATSSWVSLNRHYEMSIGNHDFYS